MELSLEAAERQIAHLNGIINAQRRYIQAMQDNFRLIKVITDTVCNLPSTSDQN
mgnify:CR=1 FL=1